MTKTALSSQEKVFADEESLEEILARYLVSIKNGSLTVIKQDGHAIQLNINEKYGIRKS